MNCRDSVFLECVVRENRTCVFSCINQYFLVSCIYPNHVRICLFIMDYIKLKTPLIFEFVSFIDHETFPFSCIWDKYNDLFLNSSVGEIFRHCLSGLEQAFGFLRDGLCKQISSDLYTVYSGLKAPINAICYFKCFYLCHYISRSPKL